jgi:diguanylate cyclase (GGDEF)-like protein/PAS domain S-box-containing protein
MPSLAKMNSILCVRQAGKVRGLSGPVLLRVLPVYAPHPICGLRLFDELVPLGGDGIAPAGRLVSRRYRKLIRAPDPTMPPKTSLRVTVDMARRGKRKTSVLFSGNPLPMWIHDAESLEFLDVNDSALRYYGYTRDEFLSLTLNDIRSKDASAAPGGPDGVIGELAETWIGVKKDGTEICVQAYGNDIQFRERRARCIVAEDVTERRNVQAELFRKAHHDGLTGLPNRVLFEQRMKQAFEAAQRRGHRASIICVDLDRFKKINDFYGHDVGDECLKEVGRMLTRRLRGMDTVARTGGEEFAIVLGEVESVAAARIVAKALLHAFASPIEIGGQSIVLGASFGIAVYPDHGRDHSDLWRRADAAMYRAKRAGGNRHELAGPDQATTSVETAGVETHMREMLGEGGLRLHYQLQYRMDGEIRGIEALLRLPHPTLGFVSTDRFIPIAEENGLIHPIGKWVIEEVCHQLMIWNSNRSVPVSIAVNVSPLQLMRPDFAEEVRAAIAQSGINPAWLEMEITERVVLNFDVIATRMEQLAAMGIRFAVDDFGTGYSSLQHLHRLPISAFKIDRSFVQNLCETSRTYLIVKAIFAMGRSLKMEVIAEGVENEDQIRLLRQLHCNCVQGFLLSRPSPPDVIESILESHIDSALLASIRQTSGTIAGSLQ